jgi:hypothetical protein
LQNFFHCDHVSSPALLLLLKDCFESSIGDVVVILQFFDIVESCNNDMFQIKFIHCDVAPLPFIMGFIITPFISFF